MKKFGHPPIVALSMQKILTVLANKINNNLSNQLVLYLKLSTEKNWMINLLTKINLFLLQNDKQKLEKKLNTLFYVMYSTVQVYMIFNHEIYKSSMFQYSIAYRVTFFIRSMINILL